MTTADETAIFEVEPARLASGIWCHRAEKTLGRGDVAASYSADRIGMDQPIRKPFDWRGGLWVCVCMGHKTRQPIGGGLQAGSSPTYREKTRDADAARADPKGFYHGMAVKYAGARMILCGPPVSLVPG